jgi:hypothetical protein
MSSRTRAAGLLLAFFVLGIAPPGFVLCVAEGEHVAIETAIEVHPCGALIELGGNDAFGGGMPVEVCTDTPLLSAALRTSSDPDWVSLPLPILTAPVPRALAASISSRAVDRNDVMRSDLRAIRAIVLIV